MTLIWVGGEDESMVGLTGTGGVTATNTFYRSSFVRCALFANGGVLSGNYWAGPTLNLTAFWLTARAYFGGNSVSDQWILGFADVSGVIRLGVLVYANNHGSGLNNLIALVKRTASGTVTVLATSSINVPTQSLNRIDLSVDYAVAGQITLYIGGAFVATYAGDITTDSVTLLAVPLFSSTSGNNGYWSELAIDTEDTRGIPFISAQKPLLNGNTDNFDVGLASSVNELSRDDTTYNASGSAGQLQQYTISGLTGSYRLRGICLSYWASIGGAGGPQHMQGNLRIASTDYLSTTVAPAIAAGPVQTFFQTNPGTSAPFVAADVNAAGFNIGVESVA